MAAHSARIVGGFVGVDVGVSLGGVRRELKGASISVS